MKKRNLNDIAKIEKAIKEKYGKEAIQNPKSTWDEEKEQKYLQDLKKFYKRSKKTKRTIELDGFTLNEKEKLSEIDRSCPVCGSYSFSSKDDLFMVKFDCCYECYVQFVEGREARWNSGWRPNN